MDINRLAALAPKLAARVEPIPPSTCWAWTGPLNNHDYGSVYEHKLVQLVHRLAYETLVGPIPRGMTIDHLCRVRSCVNPGPAHMEIVTLRVNNLRGNSSAAVYARRTACEKCSGTLEPGHRARFCRKCYNARCRKYMTSYRFEHAAERAVYIKAWRAAKKLAAAKSAAESEI